ncbi:MAG: hypothetical protein ACXVO1_10535 [Tumebacillaceae bacterium]
MRRNIILSSVLVVITFAIVLVLGLTTLDGPRQSHFITTSSTNLSGESINGIKLHQSVHDSSFATEYGSDLTNGSDNALYDYYQITDNIVFATEKHDDHIIRLIALPSSTARTSKGIQTGDSIEKVKQLYGTHSYSRSEQGMDILGYVDKTNQETIEFWHWGSKVQIIRLDITSME